MISNLDRILPPYTRRVNSLRHLLSKVAVVMAIITVAIVMGFWIGIFATLVVPLFIGIIGVLFLIAMWMADDTEPDLRTAGAALFTAYCALSVLWPGYLAIVIPGLPWVTPTRLILAAMAAVMLLQVSQSRVARDEIAGAVTGLTPAFVGYAALMILMMLTSGIASKPGDSLVFSFQQIMLWNMPFATALWLFHRPDMIVRTMRVLGISLLIVLLLTMAEYRNGLPVWIPHIPSFLQVDAPQMDAFLSSQTRLDGSYRARGTFGVHLYYSQLLLMMLPFAVHWALDAVTPTRRGWAIAYLLCMLAVIWMNNTRTGTTGQLVVIAGMLGIFGLRHYLHTQNKLDMTAPALAVGVPAAAALVAALIAISPRLQTMTIGGTQHVGSDDVRAGQWQRAWSAVASNPFGYGSGESGPLTGRLKSGIWIVDSQWINFIVDYGILAALGWALFTGIVAGAGVLIYLQKVDRSADLCGPAAVGIGSMMMTMYTISFVGNIPILLILIALVMATRHRLAVAGKLASPSEVLRRVLDRKASSPSAPARS
jgi:hypothetical protein